MKMNQSNPIILNCIGPTYYSRKDEDAFFEWIEKIKCIRKVSGAGRNLYLQIIADDLYESDLRDILALFYRYKIDMKQLHIFLNKNNKSWFYDNKKAYWHKKVFGTTSKSQ